MEDPEPLKGTLFHVDHLATRIRGHAGIAVLGGQAFPTGRNFRNLTESH